MVKLTVKHANNLRAFIVDNSHGLAIKQHGHGVPGVKVIIGVVHGQLIDISNTLKLVQWVFGATRVGRIKDPALVSVLSRSCKVPDWRGYGKLNHIL